MKRCEFLLTTIFIFISSAYSENINPDTPISKIQKTFENGAPNTQLAVYWYWISDNISKEGVIKDLEAMKRVGINRAFIGNIGLEDVEYGQNKIFSNEWWSILHTALKKATELDIEIGIFNSPGWSQSGGPWVKPEESMRYLASSEMIINGPVQFKGLLPEVGPHAKDVSVICYPLRTDVESVSQKKEKLEGLDLDIDFVVSGKQPMRSFIIKVNRPTRTSASLYYKKDNEYQLLRKIHIDRSNTELIVGFEPLADVVISLPEIHATEFRLQIPSSGDFGVEAILTSIPMVERYPEKKFAKMHQSPLPLWKDYLWDKQPEVSATDAINPSSVINITSYFSNGQLNWAVPDGRWKIVRTAMMPTGVTNAPASPEGVGMEIDKMSKSHIRSHFNAFIGEILERIPIEDRRTFRVVVQDSYETGGQNWTDDMTERFIETYNYSPIPYLPVLRGEVVGDRNISDRFLWDLRRLVADRIAYDYVAGLRELSNKNGLTTWLENYGHWGFPGEFLQYGGQSDEVSGEFWSEGALGDIENRAASSCAHIYGKSKVWAESFTAGGKSFSRYPYLMKQRGDRFFTEGINSTLLHVFIHQPYEDMNPGINAPFGNEFNRKNTWFEHLDVFIQYLKRTNFILQQGQYIADVAYFIGEDTPKMTGECNPKLPKGYSFDYINAEVLMQASSAKNGKLVLKSGMEYQILVLPRLKSMRPELLSKIRELVKQGVVVIGPCPEYSPSLQNYPNADKSVVKIAKKMWPDANNKRVNEHGRGMVFDESNSIEDVFEQLRLVPDCQIEDNTTNIQFIHRSTKDVDIYFLSNQQERKVTFDATFRTTKGSPELWDPLTGEIRRLPLYKQQGETISLPLELEKFGSAFLVFRKENQNENIKNETNYPIGIPLVYLNNNWSVKFTGMEAPEKEIPFEALYDWKDSNHENIKFFSGKAIYYNSFNMNEIPKGDIYIDLNNVMVVAKIYINGHYAGGVWTPPYRVNITNLLTKGENLIRIEVVNNWKNRLIGDLNKTIELRTTKTSINDWKADSELQSSGLLGPVVIQQFDYIMK